MWGCVKGKKDMPYQNVTIPVLYAELAKISPKQCETQKNNV